MQKLATQQKHYLLDGHSSEVFEFGILFLDGLQKRNYKIAGEFLNKQKCSY
jgi:hypothetical protein